MHDSPLRPIVHHWREKIRKACEHKKNRFGDDAEEAMNFYNGPHDFLYKPGYGATSKGFLTGSNDSDLPMPSFGMTVNKAAELVQLFGPSLYHKNPIRKVNPRKPPMLPIEVFGDPADPMVQQQWMMMAQQNQQLSSTDAARASILEFYLNYTPNALGLKDQARMAIDECLIKGMGCLFTETYRPKGLNITLVGSFYETVDNIQLDPDAETLSEAQWIARRCIHPIWQVERDYGLPPGTLKGSLESYGQQAKVNSEADPTYHRKRGDTNDLVVYWKIFSKMGLGGRLKGVPKELRDELEVFGDYCYIVICDELPYPLNLPPDLTDVVTDFQMLSQAVQWPTPFWADDTWPFTPIVFHPIPRQIWPMSHLKPAMGELKFLDWAYSFLASKIRIACRDFVAVKKAAGEELKNIILHGNDYTLIEIAEHHGTIKDVVQFLQHPNFNGDIYTVIQAVERNFEKRTGLMELMYGESATQFRSAAESQVKENNLKIRPDDMANRVEEAMTEMARKEALAARWHLTGQDVLPVMGPQGASWWASLVESSEPSSVLFDLEYRIEANSARKPNKEGIKTDMNAALQTLLPVLMPYSQATGDVASINALLHDWASANDIDPSRYLINPPPMPPPMPAPEEAPPEQAPQPA